MIENVGDLAAELESFDEWQSIAIEYRRGKPCLVIYNENNIIDHVIFLPTGF